MAVLTFQYILVSWVPFAIGLGLLFEIQELILILTELEWVRMS